MAWDDGLTGTALDIASSEEPILRVVAGPGTGKTYALMRRVARLLEEGENPERILLVTFTRVAAKDLEREIEELDVEGAENVKKGTLHSFCFNLLNTENVLVQTGRTPRMLFKFEIKFLLEDLGSGLFGLFTDREKRLRAFEAAWAREHDQIPGWPSNEIDQLFQNNLFEWLLFHKAMLVGEIIPISLRYLRDNPGSIVLSQFDHILIDEYQDLNKAEQSLLDIICGNSFFTVIGDEDQSIYESLRHANPEGIMEFNNTHDGTSDIPIDQCRRCPTRIVSMANSLISNNLRRSGRVLVQKPGNIDGDIHIVQWPTLESEVVGITNFISVKIESGEFSPGQILVLTQRRQLGYMIRDKLIEIGISAHSFFGEEILKGNPRKETCRIQEAFAMLLLLNDPEDRVALRCWLGFGSNNLRRNEYQRLRIYCYENNISPGEALEMIVRGEINIRHTTHIRDRYVVLCRRINEINNLDDRGKFDYLFPEDEPDYDMIRRIVENDIGEDEWELNNIINSIRINATQPELPTDVEYVRVMSLQKSKGLSADHVIVTGCNQGLIPSFSQNLALQELRNKIEEERRLFYVAITRARETLVLSSSITLPYGLAKRMNARHGDRSSGGLVNTIASIFLGEMGPDSPPAVYGSDWEY